jgi:hypothetical protein
LLSGLGLGNLEGGLANGGLTKGGNATVPAAAVSPLPAPVSPQPAAVAPAAPSATDAAPVSQPSVINQGNGGSAATDAPQAAPSSQPTDASIASAPSPQRKWKRQG